MHAKLQIHAVYIHKYNTLCGCARETAGVHMNHEQRGRVSWDSDY